MLAVDDTDIPKEAVMSADGIAPPADVAAAGGIAPRAAAGLAGDSAAGPDGAEGGMTGGAAVGIGPWGR